MRSNWLHRARQSASETPVGRVPVPKGRYMTGLTLGDSTEGIVGRVTVARAGRNTGVRPV